MELEPMSNQNRFAEWQKFASETDKITDKLGLTVDGKIKLVVTGLRAFGFNTDFSCEGHLDHKENYPWVYIKIEPLKRPWEGIREKPEDEEWKIYCDQCQESMAPIVRKLYNFLEEFYKNRKVDFGSRLVVEARGIAGMSLVPTYGEVSQWVGGEAQKEARLLSYQKEMLDFGEFLKKKFLKA